MGTELKEADCGTEAMQHNFTNEGGYNRRYRFLKNIMGLWMIQSVRKEIAEEVSFGTICEMASKCRISSIVDANDDRFLAPENMTAEVQKACEESGQQVPQGIAEIAAVIYNSLAVCYAKTLKELEEQTGCQYRKIHVVGGGANAGYLNRLTALTKPKYFIPVHGEQKHLRKHAGVAVSMGMPPENIFIGDVGSVVEINEDYMKQLPDVQAGAVMVDGLGVGDVGSIVLRDRKHLAEDGLIIAVCTIEAGSGRVVSGPDIVSRGFVYVRESEALMDEARRLVNSTIEQCADENVREWSAIKLRVRDNLSRLLYNRTKRSPMILPIIMEV